MIKIKRLILLLSSLFCVVLILLSFNIYSNYQKQKNLVIKSYLDLETEIIKATTRLASMWFHKRIKENDATIDIIEQEIFTNLIAPIRLLKNGDAWIYNKNYVIFDKSSDFPDEYRGKSMRQIFDIQKAYGAYHYEELTLGVENATDGKGWYVWLPDKGKEWVAWKSFRFHDQTWTLGISTPEPEIMEYINMKSFLIRPVFYSLLILSLLLAASIIIVRFQLKQNNLIEEINNANKVLKEIDKLKNEFILNISHDFRLPLTIIYNLAELNLTGQEKLPFEVREDFNTIYNTSKNFISRINRLLDLAKLETTGLKLHINKVNLSVMIMSIAEYYKSVLRHTGITLEVKIPEYDSGYINTDTEKLEDIIFNIISNAVKFVDHKSGKISIRLEENGPAIFIIISDNGIGIDRDDIEKIFKRFEQGNRNYEIKYKGSGIGLAYSMQLARLLGGNIKAESFGINKGSVFTITLNRNTFSENDLEPNSGRENSDYSLKGMIIEIPSRDIPDTATLISETNRQNEFDPLKSIILIAEDDSHITDIIIRYLKNAGYKNFITANNGEDALDLFYKYNPDMVISDYNMPRMKGDQFHDLVCSDPENTLIPFIFISAIADENTILSLKNRGAVDYLLKPINKNELLTSVNTNLKKHMNLVRVTAIDELTRFYNRRVFLKIFENILLNPDSTEVSLILFDLDHFKNVNDNYGHQTGDHVLSSICSEVLRMTRSQDVAGRYGGEEFGIILPESNIQQAKMVAEKIRKGIENLEIIYNQKKLKISASFGISSLSQCTKQDGDHLGKIKHISEMIEMADTALYYAKTAKCTSCSFAAKRDENFNGTKCPECGSDIINDRNRVEIYSEDLPEINLK